MNESTLEVVTEEIANTVNYGFDFMDALKAMLIAYGGNIIIGLLILVIGIYIAKKGRNISKRLMKRSNVDPSAVGFISQILYFIIIIMVVIAALGRVGVPTNSFVAAIGALGLAVGLSLQNNLSNFASGILILIFKPFKVGDFIEAAGVSGTVDEILIMNTVLYALDNRKIIVPNSKLTSENVSNFSAAENRKMPLTLDISYESDYKKAIEIIKAIFKEEIDIFDDPEPVVVLREFADNSMRIFALPWVKNQNFWAVHGRVMQRIKDEFDANNIEIPYPQTVIHVKGENQVIHKR
ncbi:small conductance mechanosensitive channel [Acetoanaerobium pronyense]|uniref:Small conductance mechanosensitive channel n=1 Tax=Acetoanaerobium pronyense TaxID=1482736 RepID=A0ABS4KI48_9FIRM|nr:mechanosensitive ion channel domain-containing protein [Acetoanaerobium pronyense]MBP2027462.1 small conductance mechanosensitive channel [Acetoanaerobium pronyense]